MMPLVRQIATRSASAWAGGPGSARRRAIEDSELRKNLKAYGIHWHCQWHRYDSFQPERLTGTGRHWHCQCQCGHSATASASGTRAVPVITDGPLLRDWHWQWHHHSPLAPPAEPRAGCQCQ